MGRPSLLAAGIRGGDKKMYEACGLGMFDYRYVSAAPPWCPRKRCPISCEDAIHLIITATT